MKRTAARGAGRALAAGGAVLLMLAGVAWAQSGDRRSAFPGRRVGGGTRGDCSSRMLAHLVPSDSVYVTDAGGLVGLLQGPARQPQPVQLSFRPYKAAAGSADGGQLRSLALPAAAAGVTLLNLPAPERPTVWESKYACEEEGSENADPLRFVTNSVPPVVSLLMQAEAATSADRRLQTTLADLKGKCGGTVSTAALGKAFGMEDLMVSNWPELLPVRCPEAGSLR